MYVSEGDAEALAPATSAKAGVLAAHVETEDEEEGEEAAPHGAVTGSAPNGGQAPVVTAAA